VDNLAFGGTGKTPMVLEIATILKSIGIKFSIVSRGYGSISEKKGVLVNGDHTWQEIGDEVKMIFLEFPDVDIFTGSDRIKSLTKSTEMGNKVIILDDGFQSAGIKKDLKIMMINPNHKYYYLRNFKFLTCREDVILYLKGERESNRVCKFSKRPDKGEYSFRFTSFQTSDGLPADPDKLPVFGFSALGDNERFKSDLGEKNLVGFKGFKDHHRYTKKDLYNLEKMMKVSGADFLICTYKDFVKISDLIIDGFPLIYVKNKIESDYDLKEKIFSVLK